MKQTLLTILFTFLPFIANAAAVEINGMYYKLNYDEKTAELTSSPNLYKGNIILPEFISYEGDEYRLIKIGYSAFGNCEELVSVSIPNSVISIGKGAFSFCKSLSSITIPDNVTTIGEEAFNGCSGLTSVLLGKGIYEIGEYAFCMCSNLYSITIPDNVVSMGNSVFRDCKSLTSISLGKGLTKIGNETFYKCTSLIDVKMSNNIKNIGGWAFYGCNSLVSLLVPDSVTKIACCAFENCSNLKNITIPKSVTEIEESVFSHCESLSSINILGSITSIPRSSFLACSSLKSIDIPTTIVYIGDGAFQGCKNLEKINIPKSVAAIGKNAFYGAFTNQISIPTSVHITDLIAWCNIDFENETSNPLYGAHQLYLNNTEIKDLVIPEGVERILPYAFIFCNEMTSISFAQSVKSIGQYAFMGCFKVAGNLIIPEYVETIGERAFEDCISLETVDLSDGVISIGKYSFSGCEKMTTISLGKNISLIGGNALNMCSSLKDLYCKTESIPMLGENAFCFNRGETILHVPDNAVDKYKKEDIWKDFKKILGLSTYKLTYLLLDNDIYKEQEYAYNDIVIPEAEPTKEGYTFSGWSEIPETMPAHDVTVTGNFIINTYQLTYLIDGVEYAVYDYNYGIDITPEPVPVKEGYTFSGWSAIPTTMPARNVTVTGSFNINNYKLTYMIDGMVYKEVTYEYSANITPEPAPEGDYESFNWIDLPKTMPAYDVVVNASYTTGISELMMSGKMDIRIYSLNGKLLNRPQKGINIIKYKDGTTKKVVIK